MDDDGVPPPPAKQLKPADLVKNSRVEYYSTTHQYWVPSTITDVNEETGEVTIDIRSVPISPELVDLQLRKRTIPSPERLDWLRARLRNNEIDSEATKVFYKFAKESTPSGIQCLHTSSAREIAKACNSLFGVSGWFGVIQRDCFTSQQEARLETWLSCFKKHAQSIHDTYGDALIVQGAQCHFADPRAKYEFRGKLGEGSFGVVHLAMHPVSKANRAVKQISKEAVRKGVDEREIQNLCAMDHPHIVKLFEWYDHDGDIFLVMDFCSGGELAQEIKSRKRPLRPFEYDFLYGVMKQLLSAITYMHGCGLMHLDIKGENILLTSCRKTMPPSRNASGLTLAPPQELPHAMIIDLGVGTFCVPGCLNPGRSGPCGTPLFMAPEVWSLEFSPKADVFSIGVVFFMMMSLEFPYIMMCKEIHDFQYYWSRKPAPPWNCVMDYGDAAKQLCADMMALSRQDRPTASECLQSVFIRGASGPGLHDSQQSQAGQAKIDQIVKFPKRDLLYRSVALAVAQAWPANQFPSGKRIFEHMDTEGHGQLHVDKIATSLTELGVGENDAISSAAAMALSRQDFVRWTEFMAACVDLGDAALEEDLRRIFNAADRDRDGCLSQEELGEMLAGQHLRGQALSDVFRELSGSTDPLAKVSWHTFRGHFQEDQGSESRPACPRLSRLPAPPEPSALGQAAEVAEHVKGQLGVLWEQIAERWQRPGEAPLQTNASELDAAERRSRLVQQLVDVGWRNEQAVEAAKRCSSVEAAVDWLLEQPGM